MKRFLVALVAAASMVLPFAPAPSQASVDGWFVCVEHPEQGGTLNLRTGPSRNSTVMMELGHLQSVTIHNEYFDGKDIWLYVSTYTVGGRKSGWVNADYICTWSM